MLPLISPFPRRTNNAAIFPPENPNLNCFSCWILKRQDTLTSSVKAGLAKREKGKAALDHYNCAALLSGAELPVAVFESTDSHSFALAWFKSKPSTHNHSTKRVTQTKPNAR